MDRYELSDMCAETIINRYKEKAGLATKKAVFVIGIKNDNTHYLLDWDKCETNDEGDYKYALCAKSAMSAIRYMADTKTIIVALARRIGDYFIVLNKRTIRRK